MVSKTTNKCADLYRGLKTKIKNYRNLLRNYKKLNKWKDVLYCWKDLTFNVVPIKSPPRYVCVCVYVFESFREFSKQWIEKWKSILRPPHPPPPPQKKERKELALENIPQKGKSWHNIMKVRRSIVYSKELK